MKDDNGRVFLDHFYDGVEPVVSHFSADAVSRSTFGG
jgi:hypothetical protein